MPRNLSLISVRPDPLDPRKGVLMAGGAVLRCALGRGDVTRAKREGDGATPAGAWPLRRAFYRPDRAPRPVTCLPIAPLNPAMGWSDDVTDPLYNRPVILPRRYGHESMWREDGLYDYVVVLGYNDAPPRPPRGSAIFLHLARDGYRPTEGCVAISRADMRRLLPRLGPETILEIRP